MGKRLKDRARLLKLTDADVARRVGISQPRYANYTNDANEPDLDTFVRICMALDTTPDEMLGVRTATPSSPIDLLRAQAISATGSMDISRLRIAATLLDALARMPGEDTESGDVNLRRNDAAVPLANQIREEDN